MSEQWVPTIATSIDAGPEDEGLNWLVQPAIRYVFAPGELARPYAAAAVSFGDSAPFGEILTYGVSLQFGTQLHAGEYFSFDPYLALAYDHAYAAEVDGIILGWRHANTITLSGGFALSLWL